MELKRDEIYDNLRQMEIVLEKSFSIIPFYLSAVKVGEVNNILKQIYNCIPEEFKNTDCSVYNLLKQFEFLLNNSFPILPDYLVVSKINKLKEIIDTIYVSIPKAFVSVQNPSPTEEKCVEERQTPIAMKFLIFLGNILK